MTSLSNRSPTEAVNRNEQSSGSDEETGNSSFDGDESSSDPEVDEEVQEGESEERAVGLRSSRFRALCDFGGDQEGDLRFDKGDLLTILTAREDGWWEARDSGGNRGLVPSTFLEPLPGASHSDRLAGALPDASAHSKLGAAVRKQDSPDTRPAPGAVPLGCTESTLAPLCAEGSTHRLTCALSAKLSPSGLSIADPSWDSSTNQIGSRGCRVQRLLTLVESRNVPELGEGVEVVGRCVRTCLVDGRSVLGNVHTLPVSWDPKYPGRWSPVPRRTASAVPSSLSPTFFVRSSTTSACVGLLIELCLRYRNQKSQEEGELSCGWAQLPLFRDAGHPIPNGTSKLNVSMGSPFEKSALDFSPANAALDSVHPLRAMIRNRRKPIIVVKVGTPSKSLGAQLDLLPDHLVACTNWVPYLVFYRRILADVVLCCRKPSNSAALLHSPFLTAFPSTMDQPDLLDILHMSWTEKLKSEKRSGKDAASLKSAFQETFLRTVYVLWQLDGLPPYKFAHPTSSRIRGEAFERCLTSLKSKAGALAVLLSSDHVHRPFDMSELALDLLHPNCLATPPFSG